MNIADTTGIASFIVQTAVEDGESAVDCVLTFNQVLAAVGKLHGTKHPVCDVHRLRVSRAVKHYTPSQHLGDITSCVNNQWRY